MYSRRARPALTTRLLFPIAAILVLTWLGAAVFTKKAAFRESRAFLMQEAETVVQTLLDVAPNRAAGDVIDTDETRVLMVWKGDELVFSKNAMDWLRPEGEDTRVELIGADNWIISGDCKGDVCASAGIRDTERKMAIRRLVAVIYIPMLAILGMGLWAATVAIARAIKPIKDVSTDVRDMDIDSLEALATAGVDRELEPLVVAINHLMQRMRTQLEQERAFLGLYAHEIRTPIAGLTAQMQLLEQETHTRSQTFENVQNCASRTARVANQFLALARSKNAAAMQHAAVRFDLVEQLRTTIAEVIGLHPDTDIALAGDDSAEILIDPFVVDVILRNLLDNAVLYAAPDEGTQKIIVTCVKRGPHINLSVEDNGPGLSSTRAILVQKAFQRLADEDGPKGAGLGLSIVTQMAEMFGGGLSLETSETLGGLHCTVGLPCDFTSSSKGTSL